MGYNYRLYIGINLPVTVVVPWTWEKESRGQKPKNLKKVSQKSLKSLEEVSRARGPESLKKVSKKVRKVSKNPSETFLRLFGLGPRDSFSQVHGTSRLQLQTL